MSVREWTTGPVILATRVEEDAAEPARVAVRLADLMGAELVLLYVAVEADTATMVATQGGLAEDLVEEEIIEQVRARVRAFAGEQFPDRAVRVLIGRGDVAEGIVAHASAENAAMVVVGNHKRGVLARLFQGRPAHDLLDRAPCPVLVVPVE